MKFFLRSLFGLSIAFFLVSTVGIMPVFAQDADAPPPPPPIPSVDVPDHCTATGGDGVAHAYGPSQFLGICALVAAKEQGAVSAYQLTYDNTFGFFVRSLNGVTPSATQYWALYKNGAYSDSGLSSMAVVYNDLLTFQLTDWTDSSAVGSPVSFKVGTLISSPSPSSTAGGGGSGLSLHAPFDVPLALAFLEKAQRADGSFDSPLLSDWVAIAFGVGGAGDSQRKLFQYFSSNPPSLQSIPDYERHAMALQSLGINPYSGTSIDYITPIVNGFDGKQIGDASLVNDDIFAVFPLLYAGYSTDDDVIRKTVLFILSKQMPNGSWENSVDLTSAAVQALSLAGQPSDTRGAISAGMNYVRSKQQTDGGIGNSFSTSWSLQAIAAVPGSNLNWANGYYTPQYYLATLQQRDGGLEPVGTASDARLWATAYAIPAIQGKTWGSLLSSFARPALNQNIEQAATTTQTTTTEQIIPAIASAARIEPAGVSEKLPDVAAPAQEAPAEQAPEAPAPEPAASAEAATVLASTSPQFVQAAAIATVDYGAFFSFLWLLIVLLFIAIIAGAALYLRKRRRLRKFGGSSEQKQ